MALKAGTPEFEKWRKENYNLNIRVPESAIQKLRDGKTKSNNIKRFAGTDSKVMREAMNRFYGKGWENGVSSSGGGSKGGSNNGGGTKRNAPNPGGKGPNRRGFPSQRYDGKDMNPGAYDRSGKVAGKATGKATGKGKGKSNEKFFGKNVPITSIGLGKVKAPSRKDAAVALGIATTVLPFGAAAKGIMLAKGAIQANRVLKATPQMQKAIRFIKNNATPAAKAATNRSIAAKQRAVWGKVAKGTLTKAQARSQSNAIYRAEMGKLWQATAKKAGKLR